MRLCGAAGVDDGDVGVTVMMGLLFGGLDKNSDQRVHKRREMQQKKRWTLLSSCSGKDDPQSVEKVGRLRRMVAAPCVSVERIQGTCG